MDNSEFRTFFQGLSEDKQNEEILRNAEAIVNVIETKQKFEKGTKELNREKYRWYLNLCTKPTEDILYTIHRLIGGIASTDVFYRKGFTLTYSLLIEKFFDILNMNELISIIEKETNVSKGEKGKIRSCAISGKIIMLKEILEIPMVSQEHILSIFKILLDLLPQSGLMSEATLQVLYQFLERLSGGYYQEVGKISRFMDKFLTQLSKVLVNRTKLENIKNINEFDMILILNCFTSEKVNENVSGPITNFLNNNTDFVSEGALLTYFKLLISSNLSRENDFHISFKHLLQVLKSINDFTKVVDVWNTLIDPSTMAQLKQISLKNYQNLIFLFSKFIMENYFILKYIKQIFDNSYFDNLMKFTGKNKFSIINSLIETLVSKLKQVGDTEEEKQMKSEYCSNLLQVFGNDQSTSLSPQSYKNFFSFLFNNLEEHSKLEYLESLSGDEMDEDEENLTYRITALKQLIVSGEVDLSKSLKEKILRFFLELYFNTSEHREVEIEDIIEDRMLVTLFAYLRVNKEDEKKPVKDTKVIRMLIKIHKMLQGLIESQAIEDFEMEDYKVYQKYFNKISSIACKNILKEGDKSVVEDKETTEKLSSVLKLSLLVLILYLKNPNEYADIISDLLEITKFDADWQKVYTDLFIELLHKGNNTLSDHLMNNFKKMSKYMNYESFQVVLGFLTQTQNEVMEVEEDEKVDVKTNGGMFEDLGDPEEVAENKEDIEMSD